MYSLLLPLHSLVRWLVLAGLLFAIYRAYRGKTKKLPYTQFDDRVRHITTTIVHIQFMIGAGLYFVSPIVNYFLTNFKEAVHLREIRFFGMEHIAMMVVAVTVISIGSAKAKRKDTDNAKFKTQLVWLTIGLIIILTSIPWPFSPLVHRPWLTPLF
ncbi:MAG: hypothetical protein EOP46_09990 [Sphingobacteriaceae bacterium]|nr:MAG: hypothetical protein EOP46_09990 [Sphingobacteriaceae bacterium]